MSKTVLIVIGVLVLIILILVIIGRIPNMKNAISRMNGWVVFAVVLLLIGALSFIALKVFLPDGPESVFSEVEDGSSEGDAQKDLGVEETEKETGTGFGLSEATTGNNGGDTTVYVTVSRNVVKIGEVPFADMTGFSDALESVKNEGAQFCLVDDYAVAYTYYQVQEILKKNGIRYAEKAID